LRPVGLSHAPLEIQQRLDDLQALPSLGAPLFLVQQELDHLLAAELPALRVFHAVEPSQLV
jgi:hypothetical protein